MSQEALDDVVDVVTDRGVGVNQPGINVGQTVAI